MPGARGTRLLGLDVGTSSAKAVLFDGSLAERAVAAVDIETRSTPDGRAEQDPEEIVTACATALPVHPVTPATHTPSGPPPAPAVTARAR